MRSPGCDDGPSFAVWAVPEGLLCSPTVPPKPLRAVADHVWEWSLRVWGWGLGGIGVRQGPSALGPKGGCQVACIGGSWQNGTV